jgi:hypothetical protein
LVVWPVAASRNRPFSNAGCRGKLPAKLMNGSLTDSP